MAAKAKAKKQITTDEIIKALVDAGYELDGFERKPGNLVVRLTPDNLIHNGIHDAQKVCTALGLQARCNVFVQAPHNLLIVTIRMSKGVEASGGAGENSTTPELHHSDTRKELCD